ncbi:hypothetical protein VVD49_18910 [Uliginosibacterium sp. H3]|uniref:Butirosin biosynthesis protein H N-terminal domain-containing protein n=1 Tax=Uliginosibacterium silvisoli TaxID=3114758 RepID=A0ABU6KA20_9RHOO|nr:hypothetical protein [Uliginosibacterium sp. H3]
MTAKILPLVESPIRGYMMYSYHLAVTLTNVDAWPWIHSNYVQLQCNAAQLALSECIDFSKTPKGEIHFTEGTAPFNPWLADSDKLDEATMESLGDSIAEYVVTKLQQDFYVETFVDEFYISALFNGGTTHFGHRLLVYGYDDERRTFNIIGFDKNSQYRQLECSYAELDAGFVHSVPHIAGRTRFFKPSADSRPPARFDPERFLPVLAEYLSSTNTLLNPDLRGDLKPNTDLWYGLKTYEFLQQYLTRWIDARNRDVPMGLDFRGFHIFWEHKKCMNQRARWLAAQGYAVSQSMLDRFSQVQTSAESARNLVVMCRRGLLPRGREHLIPIPEQMETTRRIEAEVLAELAHVVAQHAPTLHGEKSAQV